MEDAMAVPVACFILSLLVVVANNIPELRVTLHAHHARAYIGAACYIGSAALGYAVILWLLTISLIGLGQMAWGFFGI
jgi:hypothetical protein